MRYKTKISVIKQSTNLTKTIKKIIKWSLPIILLFFIILMVLGAMFQQRVVTWLANGIKKELAIPLKVKNIRFSLIENFPNTSVILNDAVAYYPSNNQKDTLLSVKKIYLNLNLISLIRGEIHIRSFEFNQARANDILDKDGKQPTIKIWKNPSANSDLANNFMIRRVFIEDLTVHIWEIGQKHRIVNIDKIHFKGSLTTKKISGKATLRISKYITDSGILDHIINNKATIDIDGDYIYGQNLSVSKLLITTPSLESSGSFSIIQKGSGKGGNFDFFLDHINPELARYFINTKKMDIISLGHHKVHVTGTIVGPDITDIHFVINSMLKDGAITYDKTLSIKNLNYNLSILGNIKQQVIFPQEIICRDISFDLNSKPIKANFNILLQEKKFSLSSQGSISPAVLSQILRINSPAIDGDDINFLISIKSINFIIKNPLSSNLSIIGNIDLHRLNIKLDHMYLHDISGELEIDDTLTFKKISIDGDLGQLQLDGIIPHWKQTFLSSEDRAPVDLTGSVTTTLLNLNLPAWGISQNEKQTIAQKDTTGTPIRIGQIKLNFSSQKIILHQLSGQNAQGLIIYIPHEMFAIENATFNSFGGKMQFGLKNQITHQGNTISIAGKIERMDIDSLFKSFNNFHQSFITGDNLSGKITVDFQLVGNIQDGNLLNDSLRCISNLFVENGVLKHYEPLKRLSRFINMKELETIKFQTLQNSIRIEKGVITIPKMHVQNSALNLSLSGTHQLKGDFDYRIQLKLGDVLWRSKKQSENYNPDLGIVEQKVTGEGSIYLRFFGNPNNYKFIYDKDMALETLSLKLKREGEKIKNLFTPVNQQTKTHRATKQINNFRLEQDIVRPQNDTIRDSVKVSPLKKNSGFKIDWD
jgi:hypothetical protein